MCMCTDADGDVKLEDDEANDTQVNGDAPPAVNGDDSKEKEEEDDDPDRIPDNACETLYLQNLNEKVRTSGQSSQAY